nr:transposase [uncultured Neokomagataea sp.]
MSNEKYRMNSLSTSRQAVLWLARKYGAVTMIATVGPLQWRTSEVGVLIRAHGIIVRNLRESNLFEVHNDGTLHLTERGNAFAERLTGTPQLVSSATWREEAPSYWLTDEQMQRVSACFPTSSGMPRNNDRRVVSGIVHVLRSGIAWKHAPSCYGPSGRLIGRYRQWVVMGVLDKVLANLMECRDGVMRLVIDEDILLAHRSGRTYAERGHFPIIAPVEDMPCAA